MEPYEKLENLSVAKPCDAKWSDMKGDYKVRFCELCGLNVYNLSAMKRKDAEAFIGKREGRSCVRFYRRADGTVLTADCPVGLKRWRLRMAKIGGAVLAALAVIGLSVWIRSFYRKFTRALDVVYGALPAGDPVRPRALMGEVALPASATMGKPAAGPH